MYIFVYLSKRYNHCSYNEIWNENKCFLQVLCIEVKYNPRDLKKTKQMEVQKKLHIQKFTNATVWNYSDT